jgi:hypothetical protein
VWQPNTPSSTQVGPNSDHTPPCRQNSVASPRGPLPDFPLKLPFGIRRIQSAGSLQQGGVSVLG